MIASSVIAGALLKAGFTVPQIFLFTGLANAVVAAYIFLLVPSTCCALWRGWRRAAFIASRCRGRSHSHRRRGRVGFATT